MLTAITGINWGDEGKGRMVDLISQEYDIVEPAPESVLRPLSQFSSKKLINTPAVNNGTRIRIL